jgi:hypothetical protein
MSCGFGEKKAAAQGIFEGGRNAAKPLNLRFPGFAVTKSEHASAIRTFGTSRRVRYYEAQYQQIGRQDAEQIVFANRNKSCQAKFLQQKS